MKNKIVAFTLLFFFLAPRVFAKHQEPGPNLSKNQNDLPSCNEQDAQKLEEWVMKLIPNTNQNKNTVPIPQQKTNIVEALDVIAWGNDEARRVSQENLRKLKDKGIDIAPLAISYYQDFKNHGTKTDLKESVAQRLYKFTLKELEIDVTSQIPVKESRPAQSTPRDEFKDYSAAKSAFGLLNEKDIPLEKFPAFIDQVSEITASANPFYCEAPGDIHALRDKTLPRMALNDSSIYG